MGRYIGFDNYENLKECFSDYRSETDLGVDDEDIILAIYEQESYEGRAIVIFQKDGELYEVYGSHCSCNGLEGQWEPEKTSTEALRHRIEKGGWGICSSYKNEILAVLENIDAKQ